MKVLLTDSFWKSLKVLSRHQTWWYKTYAIFRYKIPMFLKNIWFFRKELWEFRSWDYSFNLELFCRSLEKTAHTIENFGHEVDETRLKKVEKMKRVIFLIKRIRKDEFISDAESVLGKLQNSDWFGIEQREDTPEEKKHNRKVFELARQIENKEWNELWSILRGQELQEYIILIENTSEEERKKKDLWSDWYDGSDMRSWWD